MVKARTYKLSSSVKVEQLEAELSLQLQALRTEIENNETHGLFTKSYSSVHIPKDVSYFRTERQQVLQKGLKVAGVKPVVSQAGVIQKELESCLGQEYTPESLPLLLHQFFTDRTYQLAQFKYQLMLRWKRFCRHSIILEQLYPQYKDHMTHLTKEFEDAKHRAHRLAVSRERVLTGTGNPINVVMPEDVVIYLQWLICHLHSVKTIHCFLHVLHYLPMCERREEDKSSFPNFSSPAEFSGMFGSPLKVPLHAVKLDGFRAQLKHLLSHYKIQYNTESIKTSADHFELFSMVKNEFKAIFQSQNVMSTFLQYESTEAVDTKWGRRSPNMALRKECNWIPHIRVKPKRDPWQQKQMFRLKEMRCVDEFLQMHSRSCEVSDLLRVGEILMQHAAFVCEPKSMESLSVTSKPTAMSDSLNIWRSIYNIPHLSQESSAKVANLPEKEKQKHTKKKNICYSSCARLLGLNEDIEDGSKDPAVSRGAYVSLLYLRHLRIRELKRTCLSMLNYLRSVEKRLAVDTAGLQVLGGVQESSVEESTWMSAARGGRGSAGGLGSHHYIYDTPADYKVADQHDSLGAEQADTGCFKTGGSGH